jgi:hypothetical protein
LCLENYIGPISSDAFCQTDASRLPPVHVHRHHRNTIERAFYGFEALWPALVELIAIVEPRAAVSPQMPLVFVPDPSTMRRCRAGNERTDQHRERGGNGQPCGPLSGHISRLAHFLFGIV